MTPIPINLATEDELSEAALTRLIEDVDRFAIGFKYRKGGSGYLQKTIKGWNTAARGVPFLVLTDLDAFPCPSVLINEWLKVPKHPNLLFRVAVREVESWLLADTEKFPRFLGVRSTVMPEFPDNLVDPKATLVRLARNSRVSDIREGVAPRNGSTAKQGPDYNNILCRFVREDWDIDVARFNSPSLARMLSKLKTFNPIWQDRAD